MVARDSLSLCPRLTDLRLEERLREAIGSLPFNTDARSFQITELANGPSPPIRPLNNRRSGRQVRISPVHQACGKIFPREKVPA